MWTRFGGLCDILQLSTLPAEEALVRKIAIRRARVCAKASLIEPAKKREERERDMSDCSDSDVCYNPSVITVL